MTTANATRNVQLLEVQRPFSPVQWAAVLGSLVIVLWSVPGLIVNPDFATGDSATAERVLGVDMNGWHAVSGFLVAVPALPLASRPHLVARLLPPGGRRSDRDSSLEAVQHQARRGLFYFPNNGTDALLHFATAAIFLAGSAHYFVGERRSAR